jgi:peptidoglycan/xylan/chitin deacetylase (PgdA/CDA1 family)
VLYRERIAQGAPARSVYHEAVDMKSMTTEKIEADLTARYGPNAFKPRSDIDRPFTPDELRAFAADPHVCLGNHTANHAILTNYADGQVRRQIVDAQHSLHEMTGKTPTAIAYPNGAHNDDIVRASGELGLKVGFTVRPEKHSLPLPAGAQSLLRLGRYCPHNHYSMVSQCRTYRSDFQLYGKLRGGYLRLIRKQVAQ